MRTLLAVLVLSGLSWGQVAVGVAPTSEKNVKELLGSYANTHMTMWTVALKNTSSAKVTVSESAVLFLMSPKTPIPARQATGWVTASAKLTPWAIAGRLVQDLSAFTVFLSTADVVAMGKGLTNALAGFNDKTPYILSRIKGRDIPALDNFLQIAWLSPVDLDPGATAVAFVFTEKQTGPSLTYHAFELAMPSVATLMLK